MKEMLIVILLILVMMTVAHCDVIVDEIASSFGRRVLLNKNHPAPPQRQFPKKPSLPQLRSKSVRSHDTGSSFDNPWRIPSGPANNSFAQEMHDMMRQLPIRANQNPLTILRCENSETSDYEISSTIHVKIKNISEYGFQPKSVCTYDYLNRCRAHAHLGCF
jgi:hypothetical protein